MQQHPSGERVSPIECVTDAFDNMKDILDYSDDLKKSFEALKIKAQKEKNGSITQEGPIITTIQNPDTGTNTDIRLAYNWLALATPIVIHQFTIDLVHFDEQGEPAHFAKIPEFIQTLGNFFQTEKGIATAQKVASYYEQKEGIKLSENAKGFLTEISTTRHCLERNMPDHALHSQTQFQNKDDLHSCFKLLPLEDQKHIRNILSAGEEDTNIFVQALNISKDEKLCGYPFRFPVPETSNPFVDNYPTSLSLSQSSLPKFNYKLVDWLDSIVSPEKYKTDEDITKSHNPANEVTPVRLSHDEIALGKGRQYDLSCNYDETRKKQSSLGSFGAVKQGHFPRREVRMYQPLPLLLPLPAADTFYALSYMFSQEVAHLAPMKTPKDKVFGERSNLFKELSDISSLIFNMNYNLKTDTEISTLNGLERLHNLLERNKELIKKILPETSKALDMLSENLPKLCKFYPKDEDSEFDYSSESSYDYDSYDSNDELKIKPKKEPKPKKEKELPLGDKSEIIEKCRVAIDQLEYFQENFDKLCRNIFPELHAELDAIRAS